MGVSAFVAEPGWRVVVDAYGETPMQALEDHLRLEEQAPPDPSTLGPTDVIVGIRAAQVGWVDLLMTSGQYQHMAEPPYTPGLEYAGVVLWAGPSVSNVRENDRVLADGFLTGPRSEGSHRAWGGFASYAVAPSAALHRVPEPLDFDQACCFLGNYETAYHCLITRGQLQEGETVLIHGAAGSTGLAAVHVAKLLGAKVIATGRSPGKLAVVKEQGADHVVPLTTHEDGSVEPFRDEVKALTGGKGVDVVYDGVGGAISVESLRCVRFGARFLIVGWASTPFVAKGKGQRGAPRANLLPTNLVMMKGLDVLGCPTVIGTKNEPRLRPPRLADLLRWAREGRVAPLVTERFPLTEVKDAMRTKWKSGFVGGCVVHP